MRDPLAEAAALLSGNFSSGHDHQLPQSARGPVESWRRILANTGGDKRSNWEQACGELLGLAKMKFPDDPPTRRAIVDEIFAMGRDAGIDGDEAQQFMAANSAPRVDRTRRANGHAAIDEPPPVNSAADFGLPNDDAPSVVDLPPHDAPVARKFPLLAFDQIQVDTQRRGYLVKGLLASTGLAVVWGPPKCGKSFWAVDIGMHIALGWEYRGRRVQQAPVVYIALEGQHGLPARLEGIQAPPRCHRGAVLPDSCSARPHRRCRRADYRDQGADR